MTKKPIGDKKTLNRKNVLSHLFARILMDLCIDTAKFEAMITRYVSRYLGKNPSVSEIIQARSTIKKELFGEQMTIKSLIKAFRVFDAVKVDFSVKIERRNGYITEHTVKLNIDPQTQEDAQDDENDTSP
jgi:hypothetical protein